MANIIYKQFLNALVIEKLNILEKDTYKVALLKEGYVPRVEEENNFNFIQLAYEVEDSNNYLYIDNPDKGYKRGGKYVTFSKLSDNPETASTSYSCGKVVWKNVTFDSNNSVRYVIIYRESDGLLISCHDIGVSKTIEDDDLVLDWTGISTIEITTDISKGSIDIDTFFDKTSPNALANKVITYGLERYGIVLENDPVESPMDEMDRLVSISDDCIDSLFEE